MKWSQDGSKLAYLAEKKIPKAEPFLGSIDSSEVKASESGKACKLVQCLWTKC